MSIVLTLTAADGAHSTITVPAPVVSAQVPFNVGETSILANADSGNGNLIVAQPVSLTQQGTIQSLSFYVTTAGGKLHLGIYSDASGKPGTKLAEVAEFTPVVGWNTKPTLTTPTLQPGSYWLVYLPQSNSLGFRRAETGVTSVFKALTYGAMPTTFPAGPSSTPSHWSFYATLLAQPPPPPPPPGPPSQANSTFTASPTVGQVNQPVTLTVTVRDSNNTLVPGVSVTLSTGGAGNTISPLSGTTNINGAFTSTLISSVKQTETITATVSGGVSMQVQP